MSGRGTAVGAAVGVGEGDVVAEGDASCACAPNAKHSNNRLPASNAALGASVIIPSAEIREWPVDCGIIGTSGISPVHGYEWNDSISVMVSSPSRWVLSSVFEVRPQFRIAERCDSDFALPRPGQETSPKQRSP